MNSVKFTTIIFIIITVLTSQALSRSDECAKESYACINNENALPLKVIAIFSILTTSMIGVCLPLLTHHIPALSPHENLFVVFKAFAAGIILATGFMHVLPDSFEMLRSSCLKENPWHKFPFTGFVTMLSAILVMLIDSMTISMYNKKNINVVRPDAVTVEDHEMAAVHGHHHGSVSASAGSQLIRYRVVALVLELGIVVHSVVIGLSAGATNNTCTIKGLIAALCFHQMFEGIALGGCILQAEFKVMEKAIMVFFFSSTTPFGVALGIMLTKTYKDNSPNGLIIVGLLNASSAGLLIYMAIVDLLAAEFMGPKLQGSISLQIKSYIALLLGVGGMSLMAIWA